MSPSDPVSYAMRQESWIPPQHSQVVSYWMHNIFFFIPVPPCLFWLVGRGNHFWLCAILFLVREYWPPGTYTGCPRRNVPDFRRVFLMLKYTDITQNNYVQSLNGYGDNGQRKLWSSGGSTHCTCQLTSLIDVCPWVWCPMTESQLT